MSYFGGTIQIPIQGAITLPDLSGNTVAIQANSTINSSYTLTLPDTNGTSGQYLQTNGSGVLSWAAASSGNSAADDITPGDSNVFITTTSGEVRLNAPSGENVELQIDDSNIVIVNSTGIGVTGIVVASTAFLPNASDGASLGNSDLEFSDLFLADGAVINLGNDQDVTLTHVADTGVLLNGSSVFQFRDSGLSIGSSTDGQLDIDADAEIEITAPIVDINATDSVNISDALDVGGELNVTGNTNINSRFTLAINTFDENTTDFTDLFDESNTAPIKHLQITGASSTANVSLECLSGNVANGSMAHIFYTDDGDGTANANIDFKENNLYTGSGTARFLFFNQTGQSATLVYINAGTESGWRIINVGGLIF